eukprot:TRINITY_DN13693_c0_g1_i4.p1 TRINITY_DN13693_c0_g1~~TRINITY_DN13693_c0_g1_i4.p1  ORF type:complete len:185 (-),score=20.47 TRINITY_DN13693_c0_g1_i4:329-883(-)
MFYGTSIFKSVGVSSSKAVNFILGAIQVAMTAFTAWLMDRAGRRLLLMTSSGIMATCLILVGLSFYSEAHMQGHAPETFFSTLAVVALLVYIIGFSLGMGAIPWIIMSEILPAKIKDFAGSVATLANWLSSFAVTATFNLLMDWSSSGTFWIYAAVCIIMFAFVLLGLPETKGRSLEEIQSSFQ